MPQTDSLQRYVEKRNFAITPEPKGMRAKKSKALSFVIQKHWATRLHYDFRLELDGVLLSWAVPKGPSFDPRDKRMAVHVEDHPVSYGGFEGEIPRGQYGAGRVIVWDRGTWEPVGDPQEGMRQGKLVFRLHGQKLAGLWELIRIAKPGDRQDPWLLFKKKDEWARPSSEYDVIAALPDSVVERPLGPLEAREPRGADGADAAGPAVAAKTPNTAKTADTAGAAAPSELPAARRAALPESLAPQLATLSKDMPPHGDWLYELKFDGYRLLARIDAQGGVRLVTRNGNDWTSKMQPLAKAVAALGAKSCWIDGEIVVLNAQGAPDFNMLQNAFDAARTANIVYFVFDLPYADGHDLRRVPLRDRRAMLRRLIDAHGSDAVRLSEHFTGDAAQILRGACELKFEGIIAKRADAPYVSDRATSWLKLKCSERQEFVIAGFTDRQGSKSQVGALVLGYHDEHGRLRPGGSVGTGWDAATAARLHERLVKIETSKPPFESGEVKPGRWSKRAAGTERWVKPELVAEISFGEWTPEGHVRHGVFQGLREDKPAKSITRERAKAVAAGAAPAAGKQPAVRKSAGTAAGKKAGDHVGTVKVSNPERVIDPSTGLRKIDLVRYYESVAAYMLPHLKGRAVSLVRGPTGITGQLFFQKHDDKLSIPGLRELDPSLWPEHPPLLEVPTEKALVSAAQMNVIEFHTWNSNVKKPHEPDRVIFDIDPGEGVKWAQVQEAALLTHALLEELGLKSWLKTSGGKGLHVVVPLAPKLDYDTVKDFSQAVVQHLARTIPSRFVAKSGASNRVGKIFVDYLRNGFGATTAAAFSARARPGLGVSMPVSWDQLPELKSGAQWTIATAREYLSFGREDPWADYAKCRQTLTKSMKALGLELPRSGKSG
jgi:bifunctional non-homologous end joining protein LigD